MCSKFRYIFIFWYTLAFCSVLCIKLGQQDLMLLMVFVLKSVYYRVTLYTAINLRDSFTFSLCRDMKNGKTQNVSGLETVKFSNRCLPWYRTFYRFHHMTWNSKKSCAIALTVRFRCITMQILDGERCVVWICIKGVNCVWTGLEEKASCLLRVMKGCVKAIIWEMVFECFMQMTNLVHTVTHLEYSKFINIRTRWKASSCHFGFFCFCFFLPVRASPVHTNMKQSTQLLINETHCLKNAMNMVYNAGGKNNNKVWWRY